MTQIAERAIVERGVPLIWEVLRTISGLAVVLAAVVFAAGAVLVDDAERESVSAADSRAVVASSPRPAKTIVVGTPEARPLFLFYLVATEEQAYIAEWGEVDAVLNGYAWPDHQYAVLYARNDEEEKLAGRAILQRMSTYVDPALVHVIDLRGVGTSR